MGGEAAHVLVSGSGAPVRWFDSPAVAAPVSRITVSNILTTIADARSAPRYIIRTLLLEAWIALAVSLIAVIASVFAPYHTTTTLSFQRAADTPIAAVERRIADALVGLDPRSVHVQQVAPSGHCQGGAIQIELELQQYFWEFGSQLPAIEASAQAAGLGAPCTGAHIRFRGAWGLQVLVAVGFAGAVPLLLLLVWRSRKGRHWRMNWADWHPRLGSISATVWGLGVGLLAIAINIVMQWLGLLPDPEAMLASGLTAAEALMLAPVLVLGAPVFEEYVFRAWMLERFSRVMPAWLALAIVTAVFVAVHTQYTPGTVLLIGSIGLLLGLTWLCTRSWLACTLAHGTYNAAVLGSMFLQAQP